MARPESHREGADQARRSNRDFALPCLFDRVRSSGDLSVQAYRQAVLKDLEVLLNTPTMFDERDERKWPAVADSVLNFGSPDLVGTTLSSVSLVEIERKLLRAIRRFEPRIVSDTLKLNASIDGESAGNALVIEIIGDLWVGPLPEPLFLRTTFDLETGRCELGEIARGSTDVQADSAA